MPHHGIHFSYYWESALHDDDNISCHVMSCHVKYSGLRRQKQLLPVHFISRFHLSSQWKIKKSGLWTILAKLKLTFRTFLCHGYLENAGAKYRVCVAETFTGAQMLFARKLYFVKATLISFLTSNLPLRREAGGRGEGHLISSLRPSSNYYKLHNYYQMNIAYSQGRSQEVYSYFSSMVCIYKITYSTSIFPWTQWCHFRILAGMKTPGSSVSFVVQIILICLVVLQMYSK